MTNNARIIWGTVRENGKEQTRSGFVVDRVDPGLYTITFNEAFKSEPSVTVTQIFDTNDGKGGRTLDNAVLVFVNKQYFRVKVGNDKGVSEDGRDFSFIAIGE